MDGNEPVDPAWKDDCSEILRTVYWQRRCELAEKLLRHVFTKREIGRACHILALEEKVKALQSEITSQREAAEHRNRQLRAANLIVSCSGGCDGGIIGSKENVDEKLVCEVERTANRLRAWWNNYRSRQQNRRSSS